MSHPAESLSGGRIGPGGGAAARLCRIAATAR